MRLPATISVAGWTRPHVDVTATAGRALTALHGVAPSRALRAAWHFVREHQTDEGHWCSYWWTTPLYATYQAVAFARSRRSLPDATDAVRRATRWALDVQRADGGWAPPTAVSARAFDTALGMAILSRSESSRLVRAALVRAAECLRGMQLPSGHWPAEPILRIPPPHVTRPDAYRGWRINELGTGVVVSDHRAVFTTATAIAAWALVRHALSRCHSNRVFLGEECRRVG
jgi:squalene cyclase